MREIRLPRAILAVMVGASLGLSGAALQGYLRNPLAEPGLIGVSGSAALGAVIALQTGFAASFALALPGRRPIRRADRRSPDPRAGGASGRIADPDPRGDRHFGARGRADIAGPEPLAQPVRGFGNGVLDAGSLSDRSFWHVGVAAALHGTGMAPSGLTARGLDALTLGEDAAASLGIG
jgi:iron complex transport system permease protein